MTGLYYLLSFAGLLFVLRRLLFWAGLWQLKQYSLLRVKEALFKEDTKTFKFSLLSFLLLTFLFLLPYPYDLFLSSLFFLPYLLWVLLDLGLLSFYPLHFLQESLRRFWRVLRPSLTLRAFLFYLFSFSLLLVTLPFLKPFPWHKKIFLWCALSSLPLIPLFSSFFTSLLVRPYLWYLRYKVKKVLSSIPFSHKIVITGSFGKTSTKEFIRQALEMGGFKVHYNPESQNTEIALYKTLLLTPPDTEFLVLEIGAYRRGEIEKMVKLIKPDIAILTGLTYQHLALFGSLHNLLRAKMEIVSSPTTELLIYNQDSPFIKEALSFLPSSSLKLFPVSTNPNSFAPLKLVLLKRKKDRNKVVLDLQGDSLPFNLSLPSLFLPNLALTAGLLVNLGWDLEKIPSVLRELAPPPRRFEIFRGYRGALFVDDTYSSNPEGFKKALRELTNLGCAHKVLVARYPLELGSKEKEVLSELISEILKSVDTVIVFEKRFYLKLLEKREGERPKIVLAQPGLPLENAVKREVRSFSCVLLEGRLPLDPKKAFLKYKDEED